jgi:hypothetical protein
MNWRRQNSETQKIKKMKKLVILGFLLAVINPSAGQENEKIIVEIGSKGIKVINQKTGDSTNVEVNVSMGDGFDNLKSEKKYKTAISKNANWSSFDFGVNVLFRPDWTNDFAKQPYLDFDPAKSWTFNFNVFEHYFGIAGKERQNFGLVTGLGFNLSHFGYNRNYTIVYDADSIHGFVDPNKNFSRNRLRAAYLQVPALLQFNIPAGQKNSDNFHVSLGVVGGVRIGSRLRQRYIENSSEFNIKEKRGQYFFNSFKTDAIIRLGYKDFGVFAGYNLIPLFDTRVVEPVHNLSFGLMLNF